MSSHELTRENTNTNYFAVENCEHNQYGMETIVRMQNNSESVNDIV